MLKMFVFLFFFLCISDHRATLQLLNNRERPVDDVVAQFLDAALMDEEAVKVCISIKTRKAKNEIMFFLKVLVAYEFGDIIVI